MSCRVALFGSTQRAIRGEKILKQAGFAVLAIPVPRHINSDCGIAIRLDSKVEAEAVRVLAEANLEPKSVHDLEP
ncbi:MAG: DUF3343 domain-containing protein [Actinobacteria bacterium]|nr:MAG: DUF3343 domain-containing protein [Actinomycetota bacterium]